MGLDMYLEKDVYVGNRYRDENEKVKITIPDTQEKALFKITPEHLEGNDINSITFNVMYWRKANAIHKWFVDNVQDGKDECQRVYVDKEQLVELVNICKKILNAGNDWKTLAQELLPPQPGFFFGSTELNEYYLQDLRETVETLTKELEKNDTNSDYYYHSSW